MKKISNIIIFTAMTATVVQAQVWKRNRNTEFTKGAFSSHFTIVDNGNWNEQGAWYQYEKEFPHFAKGNTVIKLGAWTKRSNGRKQPKNSKTGFGAFLNSKHTYTNFIVQSRWKLGGAGGTARDYTWAGFWSSTGAQADFTGNEFDPGETFPAETNWNVFGKHATQNKRTASTLESNKGLRNQYHVYKANYAPWKRKFKGRSVKHVRQGFDNKANFFVVIHREKNPGAVTKDNPLILDGKAQFMRLQNRPHFGNSGNGYGVKAATNKKKNHSTMFVDYVRVNY